MQIRLTVLAPRSGQTPRACDVLVTAPAGTSLAAVASQLAAAVSGPDGSLGSGAVVLFAGRDRLDAQRSALGEPPLVDGAVLSLQVPGEEEALDDAVPAQLHVVAGPDAGGVHLLHGGQIRIGRSADADVPLDDPDVSRLHCAVTVGEDGRVSVADLGSTNGTSLDGADVGDRPVRLTPGALLRLGESTLRLTTGTRAPTLPTTPDGEGHLRVPRQDRAPTGGEGPAGDGRYAHRGAATAHGDLTGSGSGSGSAEHDTHGSGRTNLAHAAYEEHGAGAGPGADTRTGTGSAHGVGGRYGTGAGTDAGAGTGHGEGTGGGHGHRPGNGDGTDPGGAGGDHGDMGGRRGDAGRYATSPRGPRSADPDAAAPRRGGIGAWARRLTGAKGEAAHGTVQGTVSGAGPGTNHDMSHGTGPEGRMTGDGPAAPFAAASRSPSPPSPFPTSPSSPTAQPSPSAPASSTSSAYPSPHSSQPPHSSTPAPRASAPAGTWPDPATVLLTALGPGPRLWERDAAHPEALVVRLGTTDRADLPAVPVTVGLREAGSLGLAGPRARLSGLARATLAQLAALHSPVDLEIVLISGDRARSAEERGQEWSWLGWLPHLRPMHGQDCRLLTAYDREQATARTTELVRRLDGGPLGPGWANADREAVAEAARSYEGPHTVVVVDGDPGTSALRETTARLAGAGAAAGIHLICLAETPAASPISPVMATYEAACQTSTAFRECGAVAMLSGDVATALRLLRTAGGQVAGHGTVAAVDAVSAAWAERFGRALAPLRAEGSAALPGRPAAAALPPSARLLDELGLARATPASLMARWASTAEEQPGATVRTTAGGGAPHDPGTRDPGRTAPRIGVQRTGGADGDAPVGSPYTEDRDSGRSAGGRYGTRGPEGTPGGRPGPRTVQGGARGAAAGGPYPESSGGAPLHIPASARAVSRVSGPRGADAPRVAARGAEGRTGGGGAPFAGRPVVVLGAGPRGALSVDLSVEGPHLLIEGPAGSGRTELLRAVAASLAAAARPDLLGMVLVDGAGGERGEGLHPCTELPHAFTHLVASDPVRMRRFAQELGGELKRRAELLGPLDFTEWHARHTAAQRVIGQRAPSAAEQRGDLDSPASGTLRLRTTAARPVPPGPSPLPRLVVLVDDFDALVAPALGSPGRPAAGSVVRALEAVARDGGRLGVHLVATSARPERTEDTELARGARLRVVLDAPVVPPSPDEPAPGRGRLGHPDGRVTPFQGGRVTGRIPRTATLRPTVVPLEWERMGDPPARRPVRELGNGPTDLALLASALERAARSVNAEPVPPLAPAPS
ncbi:FHA domain-containing protein [Streptomyces sp. DT24]|uniref:FHA domain-containing protein n=1 Tax=Streptomyces sp. DT24 TaxID=3416520 RepID=UPI003CFA1AAA